jgi:DNA repair protein RadC
MVKRINVSAFKGKIILKSSSKAGEYFIKELQFLKNEVFLLTLFDSQNRLIKTEIVSRGSINESPVYPREIVKIVLDNNANSVILAHNHPGGSLQPSSADTEVTRLIKTALEAISIKVVDHIIVAEGKYTSFAEKGLI